MGPIAWLHAVCDSQHHGLFVWYSRGDLSASSADFAFYPWHFFCLAKSHTFIAVSFEMPPVPDPRQTSAENVCEVQICTFLGDGKWDVEYANPHEFTLRKRPSDRTFQWIHIPANNMAWVEVRISPEVHFQ